MIARDELEFVIIAVLEAIGEDTTRDGLIDTPKACTFCLHVLCCDTRLRPIHDKHGVHIDVSV